MSRNLGVQVLDGAIKLFERRGSWTQGGLARFFFFREVDPASRWATGWCIEGALMRSAARLVHNPEAQERAIEQARQLIYTHGELNPMPPSIHFWNDEWGRTRKQALHFLKGARTAA